MGQYAPARQIRRGQICFAIVVALVFMPATPACAETLSATVDWAQRQELGPLVGGTVTATFAEIGDRVSTGMEMMRIDQTPYLYEVRASEARVESTGADFQSSRQHYDRQQELYEIGSLSTVQLEESGYALKRAESAHKLAQASLELARYNLDKTSTRAPFDAWVIDKRVFVGQNLSTSQAIPVSYVVAPAGLYIATIDTPLAVGEWPDIGTAVEIEVSGNVVTGKVTFPPLENPAGAGVLTVSFIAKDLLLLPGMRVNVTINRP